MHMDFWWGIGAHDCAAKEYEIHRADSKLGTRAGTAAVVLRLECLSQKPQRSLLRPSPD